MEKPRRPDRTPDRQAGLDRQDRYPAVSRLSAQRGPAACVFSQRRGRQAGPGPVDLLGAPLPYPGVRGAGRPHRAPPPGHRRRPRARPLPRTHRIHQHQDPTPNPHRVRLPLPRGTDRPGHARPRRPPTRPTRPNQTPTDQSVGPEIVFCLVRSRCFQAAATSSGRRKPSMPGWWISRSRQNRAPNAHARLSMLE